MDDNEMNEVEDFDDEEEDRYKKPVRILAERHSGVQITITFAPLPTFLPPMSGTCTCPAKGSSYPNMHALACPQFTTVHCDCHAPRRTSPRTGRPVQ
jgi:hypothetical protein